MAIATDQSVFSWTKSKISLYVTYGKKAPAIRLKQNPFSCLFNETFTFLWNVRNEKCKFWGEITGSGPWVLKRRLYCYRVLSLRVVWFDWLRSKRADYFAPINYATIHARDCTDLSVDCWSDTHRLRLENQLRSQPEFFLGGPKCFTWGEWKYFCLGGRFLKHKMTRYSKNLGVTPPWIRQWNKRFLLDARPESRAGHEIFEWRQSRPCLRSTHEPLLVGQSSYST